MLDFFLTNAAYLRVSIRLQPIAIAAFVQVQLHCNDYRSEIVQLVVFNESGLNFHCVHVHVYNIYAFFQFDNADYW